MLSNSATPQTPKRSNRTFIIVLIVVVMIFVLACIGCAAYWFLSGINNPPSTNKMTELYLSLKCTDFNPELSLEECEAWVQELKQDHADDYADCVKPLDTGSASSEDLYDCFADKGLEPRG